MLDRKNCCKIVLICAMVTGLAACSDFGLESALQNKYAYWAFDEDGNLAAQGDIIFDFGKLPAVGGKWDIEAMENAETNGPHGSQGRLVGNVEDSLFFCNLHPNVADNNITLSGQIKAEAILGRWQWVTFAGPTRQGVFIASRK